MFKLTKILMLLWTLGWGGMACAAIGMGATTAGARPESFPTVEELLEQEPELTREDAERRVAASEAGAAIAGAGVAGVGVVGSGVVWFIGMVPLLVFYLIFKPSSETTVVVQQGAGAPRDFRGDRR